MKRAKSTILILSLALASCSGTVGAPTATPQTVELRLLTTADADPLLQDVAAAYWRPGTLLAINSVTTSLDVLNERLRSGSTPFALTSYVPATSGLWIAPVALDGLAIIVHQTNSLPALTLEELRLVFQGRIATWADLGGPDLPVQVVSREPGADTRLALEDLVLGERRITLGAQLALSGQSMIDTVAELPGGIGYVSLGLLSGSRPRDVRTVPLKLDRSATPVAPTPDTVTSGAYPLRTTVAIVGLAPPADDSLYHAWFAWMQSSAGQTVIGRRYGTLPY